MRCGDISDNKCVAALRHLVVGVFLTLYVGVLIHTPASAQQRIDAVVCSSSAQVAIEQPLSDSITNTSDVTLRGTVAQANQIEISIDGSYDSVVSLVLADKQFTTSVHLTAGTHTIQAKAIDACGVNNAVANVIVTYQPVSQSSVGNQTPTIIKSGVIVTSPITSLPSTPGVLLPTFITQPLTAIGDYLNLTPAESDIHPGGIPQLARFSLITVGALILFFSQVLQTGYIGTLLADWASRLGLASVSGSKLLIRTTGLILLVLAFIL